MTIEKDTRFQALMEVARGSDTTFLDFCIVEFEPNLTKGVRRACQAWTEVDQETVKDVCGEVRLPVYQGLKATLIGNKLRTKTLPSAASWVENVAKRQANASLKRRNKHQKELVGEKVINRIVEGGLDAFSPELERKLLQEEIERREFHALWDCLARLHPLHAQIFFLVNGKNFSVEDLKNIVIQEGAAQEIEESGLWIFLKNIRKTFIEKLVSFKNETKGGANKEKNISYKEIHKMLVYEEGYEGSADNIRLIYLRVRRQLRECIERHGVER